MASVNLWLATSLEFINAWRPLPESLDSYSKQQPPPQMRPEAAHCSLEASESESCCQATVYRWREGSWLGPPLLPTPLLVLRHHLVNIKSAWPWIIDLIFFFLPWASTFCRAGPTRDVWDQLSPTVTLLFLDTRGESAVRQCSSTKVKNKRRNSMFFFLKLSFIILHLYLFL